MLEQLVEFSNRYGRNPEYVLAGGGNTSQKDETTLYIKASGKSLADVTAQDFVSMDRAKLSAMLGKNYPESDDEREAAALADVMAARLDGNGDKRPSVEASLHNLFNYKYVLHLHPALINGLTCSRLGEKEARRLIGDDLVWIDQSKPGYALAKLCDKKLAEYKDYTEKDAQLMFLQNHGIFVAGDTVADIDAQMLRVMSALQAHISGEPDMEPLPYDKHRVDELGEKLKKLYPEKQHYTFVTTKDVLKYIADKKEFEALKNPFTPDHIVYAKARFMYLDNIEKARDIFDTFVRENGYTPKVICVPNLGAYIITPTEKELKNVKDLFLDAVKVAVYANNFGGFLHMTDDLVKFILNWEVESYRQKVASK